jgi:hypothetical protein
MSNPCCGFRHYVGEVALRPGIVVCWNAMVRSTNMGVEQTVGPGVAGTQRSGSARVRLRCRWPHKLHA